MRLVEFLRGQMSEADGTPSNNRIMLFLFLTTVMLLLLTVVFAPVFRPGLVIKLPDIPPSFETFVEYITVFLVGGSVLGKGVNAYRDIKVAGKESA